MATESFKATLRSVAVSISAFAIAPFLDGVFWRIVFLLGDVFTHLEKALHALGSVAGGLPVEAEPQYLGRVEGRKTADVRPNDDVHEGNGEHCKKAVDVKPKEDIHEANGQGFHVMYHRREAVQDDVGASSQVFSHYSEGNVPQFICNVACHRVWRKWYAILLGKQPGVYNCWDCVEPTLRKFRGKKDKSF